MEPNSFPNLARSKPKSSAQPREASPIRSDIPSSSKEAATAKVGPAQSAQPPAGKPANGVASSHQTSATQSQALPSNQTNANVPQAEAQAMEPPEAKNKRGPYKPRAARKPAAATRSESPTIPDKPNGAAPTHAQAKQAAKDAHIPAMIERMEAEHVREIIEREEKRLLEEAASMQARQEASFIQYAPKASAGFTPVNIVPSNGPTPNNQPQTARPSEREPERKNTTKPGRKSLPLAQTQAKASTDANIDLMDWNSSRPNGGTCLFPNLPLILCRITNESSRARSESQHSSTTEPSSSSFFWSSRPTISKSDATSARLRYRPQEPTSIRSKPLIS